MKLMKMNHIMIKKTNSVSAVLVVICWDHQGPYLLNFSLFFKSLEFGTNLIQLSTSQRNNKTFFYFFAICIQRQIHLHRPLKDLIEHVLSQNMVFSQRKEKIYCNFFKKQSPFTPQLISSYPILCISLLIVSTRIKMFFMGGNALFHDTQK